MHQNVPKMSEGQLLKHAGLQLKEDENKGKRSETHTLLTNTVLESLTPSGWSVEPDPTAKIEKENRNLLSPWVDLNLKVWN
jgi:hypothetical protein